MTAQERAEARQMEREQRVGNLWVDAWKRLVRNKAAVVGGVIIILLIVAAITAPIIAPMHYAEGDSAENYTIPTWLAPLLPGNVEAYATISDNFLLGADFL